MSEESRERNAIAWQRLIDALQDTAATPELQDAPGVWQFAVQLEGICEDIAANVSDDSTYDEAMQKLRAGFRRAMKQAQDRSRREAREWIRGEWSRDKGGFATKKDFAEVFVKRLYNERHIKITEKRLIDDWLKGI